MKMKSKMDGRMRVEKMDEVLGSGTMTTKDEESNGWQGGVYLRSAKQLATKWR